MVSITDMTTELLPQSLDHALALFEGAVRGLPALPDVYLCHARIHGHVRSAFAMLDEGDPLRRAWAAAKVWHYDTEAGRQRAIELAAEQGLRICEVTV